MMKKPEYEILERLLEKNRRLFRKKLIESDEYIENHDLIMKKIKSNITQLEQSDMSLLLKMDLDETRERFRAEIFIIKYNLN